MKGGELLDADMLEFMNSVLEDIDTPDKEMEQYLLGCDIPRSIVKVAMNLRMEFYKYPFFNLTAEHFA